MLIVVLSFLSLLIALIAYARAAHDHFTTRSRVEQLRLQVAKAERLLEQRSRLANEVAHEIKNPITAILCSAEALDLLIGPKVEEMHRDTLRYIREYSEHLLHLVGDFLDLSQAEGGHLRCAPEAVSLNQTIQNLCGLLQSSALKKQFKIQNRCKSQELFAMIDPQHLKQILFNLMHNAIKFGDPGGEVWVDINYSNGKNFVDIEIGDTGPGIPTEQQPMVFELYNSPDWNKYKNQRKDTGSGIGLALCKTLVQLAGGTISIKSSTDSGTVFSIQIPHAQTANRVDKSDNEAQENINLLHGQHFLVIDGDQGSRQAIAGLISAWGGLVDSVAQASEAVRALTQESYSAIVIDDSADGLPANEIASVLRQSALSPSTKIVLATRSYPKNSQDDPNFGIHADTIIQKPLSGKQLLRSILDTREQ